MCTATFIRHSSPTLAGLKTGSLFLCPYCSNTDLAQGLRIWNRTLVKKGLYAVCVKKYEKKALIYVYRASRLRRDLADPLAAEILKANGYLFPAYAGKCIAHLMKRLEGQNQFPHEIGLFLGYPPKDVQGFIENKAGGCKYLGWWKVYDDVETASKLFQSFNRCKKAYCDLYKKGVAFERLVVAG